MLKVELLAAADTGRAARLFHRDGFVAIGDVLDAAQLATLRAAAGLVITAQTAADPEHKGNRGHHRYSFGDQTHRPEWQSLIALDSILPILDAIWAGDAYVCCGTGGDYCLPEADYQPLHCDQHIGIHDPLGQVSIRDTPAPVIAVNFPLIDFTGENGAVRQIPGTQRSHAPLPPLDEEPEEMKNSLVCAPAGSALIRDVRCWHGGTPNRSREARAMLGVYYYAPWFRDTLDPCLPRRDWERMPPRAHALCRYIVRDED